MKENVAEGTLAVDLCLKIARWWADGGTLTGLMMPALVRHIPAPGQFAMHTR